MNAKQFLQILKEDGWYLKDQDGTSHKQFIHSTKPGKVTFSNKGKEDIPKGTLNSMLKQAGLK